MCTSSLTKNYLNDQQLLSHCRSYVTDMLSEGVLSENITASNLYDHDHDVLCAVLIKNSDNNLDCIVENEKLLELTMPLYDLFSCVDTDDQFAEKLKSIIGDYYKDIIDELITLVLPECIYDYEQEKKEEQCELCGK